MTLVPEALSIDRTALSAAYALIPQGIRLNFLELLFGLQGHAEPQVGAEFASFPLNVEQARTLKERVDKVTIDVLKAALSNEKDGVATVDWSDVKRITGVTNWAQFAQGRRGGLHRALTNLPGVPQGSQILIEGDGWVEDGHGDFSAGTLFIDGPAMRALKTALLGSPTA